jgi:type II secretory pathway component PulM
MRSMTLRLVHPVALPRQRICAFNAKLRAFVDRAVEPICREPARILLALAAAVLVAFLFVLFASPISRRH